MEYQSNNSSNGAAFTASNGSTSMTCQQPGFRQQ